MKHEGIKCQDSFPKQEQQFFHLLSSMSLPWVTKLLAIIESDAPINQKAAQALDLLKASGLAYEAKLKAKDMLVHTSNRGGAMVNHSM